MIGDIKYCGWIMFMYGFNISCYESHKGISLQCVKWAKTGNVKKLHTCIISLNGLIKCHITMMLNPHTQSPTTLKQPQYVYVIITNVKSRHQ